eukprot:365526-Chlamydomonas_euryale.AAC.18
MRCIETRLMRGQVVVALACCGQCCYHAQRQPCSAPRLRPAHAPPSLSPPTLPTPPADERTAPANIFEAAEQGAVGWIVKTVERAVEFNINQRVGRVTAALGTPTRTSSPAGVSCLPCAAAAAAPASALRRHARPAVGNTRARGAASVARTPKPRVSFTFVA